MTTHTQLEPIRTHHTESRKQSVRSEECRPTKPHGNHEKPPDNHVEPRDIHLQLRSV